MKNLNLITVAKIAGSYLLKAIGGALATLLIVGAIIFLITKLF